ncbi:MAG: hypothetical protein GTO18_06975 [Anaerolineales bacterium]|nr:hypothetical protein [Anaerolineales bacterium]
MRLGRKGYLAIILGFVAIAATVILLMLSGGPEMLRTKPGDGDVVSSTSWVGVEFSEPMDIESAQDHFDLAPTVKGSFIWNDEWMWFRPDEALEPGSSYTASLDTGAKTLDGGRVNEAYSWTFDVLPPAVLYLTSSNDEPALMRIELPPDGGEIAELVSGKPMVFDYAVSQDGSQIVLSAENEQGGSDLLLIGRNGGDPELLVDCGGDRCDAPAWSPLGERIAYRREPYTVDTMSGFDPPRLWTVDPYSGETSELLHDDHILGGRPNWSPDGVYIAFYDAVLDGIRIIDLHTGSEAVLPSSFGVMGGWSPTGDEMIISIFNIDGNGVLITLHRADLKTGEAVEIVGEETGWIDVGMPAWSLTGEWVAVGAQGADSPGRGLWLLRPNGEDLQVVISDPGYTLGGYIWDPSGRIILFQRFKLDDPEATPEVLIWYLEDGSVVPIAQDAWLPVWQ